MCSDKTSSTTLTVVTVWDRTTRWFHWINVACVLTLTVLGLVILNGDAFGISGEGKILLKTLHVYTGYVFVVNLSWRLIWAFIGGIHARWSAILPFRSGFVSALKQSVRGLFTGKPPEYLGHDPLGRLMVTLLLVLLTTQAVTGLVLAGTDLYKPPLGGFMAEWVTGGDAEKLAQLKPGSKEFIDPAGYEEMRAFRKPVVNTHLYVFYLLMASIALHIAGVVVAEIRSKHGLVSAMIHGRKRLSGPPVDQVTEAGNPERPD